MAGDPAIEKVKFLLVALTRGVLQDDGVTPINVFVDRSEDDPIREEERPAAAIRVVDVQLDPSLGMAETRHNCTLDVDFYEEALTFGGLSKRLSVMASDWNALVAADRTLSGRLERFEIRSLTAELDAVPDLGCAIVTSEFSFITPRGDWTTIQGATGIF